MTGWLAALLGKTWASLQPTSREASPLQAALDVGTLPHEAPDETRAIVLDHADDRALIDAEIIVVEPTQAVDDMTLLGAKACVVVGRIERVEKAILAEERITVLDAHRLERGHGDFRSEGHRAAGGRRRDRAVVVNIIGRGAARGVSVKLSRHVVDDHRPVDRTVGSRESPKCGAVVAGLGGIVDCVRALRDRRAARVFEVVDAAAAHVAVLNAAEIDGRGRVLMPYH